MINHKEERLTINEIKKLKRLRRTGWALGFMAVILSFILTPSILYFIAMDDNLFFFLCTVLPVLVGLIVSARYSRKYIIDINRGFKIIETETVKNLEANVNFDSISRKHFGFDKEKYLL